MIVHNTDNDKGKNETSAGIFSNVADAVTAIMDQQHNARSVYCTLNPTSNEPTNRLEKNAASVKDAHISNRVWLLVDIDRANSKRKRKNANAKELKACESVTMDVYTHLLQNGFGTPIQTHSGNGYGLVYACDIAPNDQGLVNQLLVALSDLFSTPDAHVDVTVANAARLTRIAGTANAKAPHTTDRPQRIAKLISAPIESRSKIVEPKTIQAFLVANGTPFEPATKAESATLTAIKAYERNAQLQHFVKSLPPAASDALASEYKPRSIGSGQIDRLTQFTSSMVASGYAHKAVEYSAMLNSTSLELTGTKAQQAKQIRRAYNSAVSFIVKKQSTGTESTGRKQARQYMRNAWHNPSIFGSGVQMWRGLLTYTAICNAAVRAGNVHSVGVSVREIAEQTGTTRQAAQKQIAKLIDCGMLSIESASAIVLDDKWNYSPLTNRYRLENAETVEIKNTVKLPLLISDIPLLYSNGNYTVFLTPLHDVFRSKTLTTNYAMAAKLQYHVTPDPTPHKWTVHGLSFKCAPVYAVLSLHPLQVMTGKEIGAKCGLSASTANAALRELSTGKNYGGIAGYNVDPVTGEYTEIKRSTVALHLAERVRGGWLLSPKADLNEAAERIGVAGSYAQMCEKHKAERRIYSSAAPKQGTPEPQTVSKPAQRVTFSNV